METVTCDLCGSSESVEYAHPSDWLLGRPETSARLVRCRNCTLVYQSPRPTLDEIGVHYPPTYESYGDYRAKSSGRLLRMAYNYGMHKRCRYVMRRKTGGKLLDVGCASGLFLVALREQGGWEVEGVELDAGAAAYARATYNLTVHTGTIEQAQLPAASFDAVTLWDVLEHLHRPTETLREIRRIMKPGGTLVIRVPNLGAWDANLFGDAWAGLDAPRHLYVYTHKTLQATLENAGFIVEEWDTAIGSYPVFVLSVRFALNKRQVSEQTMHRANRLLYHPLTRIVAAPFFAIPSVLHRGPLLVMTARVPA